MTKEKKEEFLKLYEPVHESFARFCSARAYGLMEAEDLVSESVLKALENFHKLKDSKAFLSFLFSIASNIINNKNRRRKFKGEYKETVVEQIPEKGLDPELNYDISVLYHHLNQLPQPQKEALILFEISGFSIKEVAEIQKASESAVKQRLKRGRESLADMFKNDQLKHESVNSPSTVLMSLFF